MNDFPSPYPVQLQPSKFWHWMLRRIGWRVAFAGLPAQQGVLTVYPHTSNWDPFVVYIAKRAVGLRVRFWAKESLFKIPLLGPWLRSFGGVPIVRGAGAQGVVGATVTQIREAQARGERFWLALAPEGTRAYVEGWRSGFYRVAVQADLPLGLWQLDYKNREVRIVDFIRLTGNETEDFARIAQALKGAVGLYPEQAGPVRLLESSGK